MISVRNVVLMVAASLFSSMAFGADDDLLGGGDSNVVMSNTTSVPSSKRHRAESRWLNIGLMVGQQSYNRDWSPYANTAFISAYVQRRLDDSPVWFDGSITVSWGGETDADGHRAGPGISCVELLGGVGHCWYPEESALSFYAGGGLAYVYGSLELPDYSRGPLPISEFLGWNVYPDWNEAGHFWGGYLRAGIVVHVAPEWGIGIGCFAIMTNSRNLLDRTLNASSFGLGLSFEGGN